MFPYLALQTLVAHDRDYDGLLSPQESHAHGREGQDLFAKFDKDQDSWLDEKELLEWFKWQYETRIGREVDRLMALADTDKV